MPWGVLWGVRRPRVDQGSPREAPGGLGLFGARPWDHPNHYFWEVNRCFVAWAIFDETKGLLGFRCVFMVFINVPSAEQGGEFIGNTSRN